MVPGLVTLPQAVSLQDNDQFFAEWSAHLPGNPAAFRAEGRTAAAARPGQYPPMALVLDGLERQVEPWATFRQSSIDG